MSARDSWSNPYLDSALEYVYPPYSTQTGREKVVAFGEQSYRCPVHVSRVPPCTAACPAGEDVRGLNTLLSGSEEAEDGWNAAWLRIVERNPFPAVTGRVCPHPCEQICNRGHHDESVGINAVEQAVGDHAISEKLALPSPASSTGKRVAVVGGGPAGLSAAYQLRRRGHGVVLFDANPELGGMMRYGIMGYRVDRAVLDAEIQRIVALGLDTRLGVRIGADVSLQELETEYDAVFVAIGAQIGRMLPFGSGQARGDAAVMDAIRFLRCHELEGSSRAIGQKVLVVGDGDVALDAARLALRLGAGVEVVSAVPRDEMACSTHELEAAEREGVRVHYRAGAVGLIERDGRLRGLACVRMTRKAKGEEGWDSPIPFLRYEPLVGEELEFDADMIVISIGQTTDPSGLEELTGGTPWLKLDGNYRVRGKERVFGGGDAFEIGLLADAIGQGRLAADSIDRLLRGEPQRPRVHESVIGADELDISYYAQATRKRREWSLREELAGSHEEVSSGLDRGQAQEEAARCLECGQCLDCRRCRIFCPQEAISESPAESTGGPMHTDYNRCVGCYICALICPSGFIRMSADPG